MYKSLMSMVIEEKCIQSYKLVLHRNDWMQKSVFSFYPSERTCISYLCLWYIVQGTLKGRIV